MVQADGAVNLGMGDDLVGHENNQYSLVGRVSVKVCCLLYHGYMVAMLFDEKPF